MFKSIWQNRTSRVEKFRYLLNFCTSITLVHRDLRKTGRQSIIIRVDLFYCHICRCCFCVTFGVAREILLVWVLSSWLNPDANNCVSKRKLTSRSSHSQSDPCFKGSRDRCLRTLPSVKEMPLIVYCFFYFSFFSFPTPKSSDRFISLM